MKTKQLFRSSLLLALPLAAALSFTLALSQKARASSLDLDPNFNAPFFATPDFGKAVPLPDGKYMVFFNVDTVEDQSTGSLMRFNSDGTLDTTFSFSTDYSGVNAVASAPGGKLIVAANKTVYGVFSLAHQIDYILRLNSDGSIDPTFGPAQSTDGEEVRVISVNGDGTIFVAGKFSEFNGQPNFGLVRLLSNGTLDPTFGPIMMTCSPHTQDGNGTCGIWQAAPVIDANGKILIAGDFVSVNGVPASGVARLNDDGTIDPTFNASGFSPWVDGAGRLRPVRGLVIQSDNKIVISGRFTVDASFASNPTGGTFKRLPLIRMNPDGSADQSYGNFGFPTDPINGFKANNQLDGLIVQADDKVIAGGGSVWRFNTDGSLDSSFHNVDVLLNQQDCPGFGCAGVYNLDRAADGKLFIAGVFSDIDDANGPPNNHWGVAKINPADGTVDASFVTPRKEGEKIEPASFLRQSDGSTLIAFSRLSFDGYPAISHGLGRLSPGGALDLTFDPIAAFDPNGPLGPNFLSLGFTALPDGSFLLTGQGGTSANYGHLLANGSEDTNYHPDSNVLFATGFPRTDGKVVLSSYNSSFISTLVAFGPNFVVDPNAEAVVSGTQVQRINSDGSVDSSFHLDSSIVASTQQRDQSGNLTAVYAGSSVLALTANNTVLFGYFSSDGNYHLVRLNNDGSIDSSFTPQTFPVSVTTYSNWVVDPADPVNGTMIFVPIYYPVDIPLKEAKPVLDNKVVLMGSFANYGSTPAHGMLRVNPDGSADPSFNIGGGAQWTQTQAAGTFQPSIDNLEVGLDDKLLLTGTFEAFNGTAAPGIISLNPDGTIDPSFVAPVKRQQLDYQPAYLGRQNDGSFLLSGPYSPTNSNISPSFLRLLLPPGTPTPTGSNVSVDEGSAGSASDISVNFATVSQAGTTSVSVIESNFAGLLPPGFQISGPNLAFEIYTTASYTSPVNVCFTLSSMSDADFAVARVLHNNGSGLIDVTSSKNSTTKTICAMVPSLSPFVIAKKSAFWNYTVFVLGGTANFSSGTDNGDVAVAAGAKLQLQAPSKINGNLYVASGGSTSGPGKVNGTRFTNQNLSSARSDAITASSQAAAFPPNVTFSNVTANQTVNGFSGVNVVKVTGNINLNNASLKLNGPPDAYFIVNVTGSITLGGSGGIVVSGGMPASHLLINMTGSGNLLNTHIGNVIQGTLLAPNAGGTLAGTVGAVLLGQNFSLMTATLTHP
jgi:hypothetical protein